MSSAEAFWMGPFGDEYTKRNAGGRSRVPFFRHIMRRTGLIHSACELGAGRGDNLSALHCLGVPHLLGVEINRSAYVELSRRPGVCSKHSAILDFKPRQRFDLAFTMGVLIHVPPADLPATYDKLVECSSKWVLLGEYFSPTPTEVPYRGHAGRLWKRDFAGELLDRHPGVTTVDYGFLWKRGEPAWDDITWFLLRKV